MRWTKLKRHTLRSPYSACIRWFIGKEQNEAANSTHSRSITIEQFSGKTKPRGGESARAAQRREANLLAQYQLSEMKHSAAAALMQIHRSFAASACTSLYPAQFIYKKYTPGAQKSALQDINHVLGTNQGCPIKTRRYKWQNCHARFLTKSEECYLRAKKAVLPSSLGSEWKIATMRTQIEKWVGWVHIQQSSLVMGIHNQKGHQPFTKPTKRKQGECLFYSNLNSCCQQEAIISEGWIWIH
jgi:hypothetical protein